MVRFVSTITGAEKAAIDRQDRPLADAFQHHLGLRLSSITSWSLIFPRSPNKAILSGMASAAWSLPGVGGTSWVSTRCARPSPGWWVMVARTFGVPAWPYQRRRR
jgi:hypothetical protein